MLKKTIILLTIFSSILYSCNKLIFNNFVEYTVTNNSSKPLAWVQVYAVDELGNKNDDLKVNLTRFENVEVGIETETRKIYFNEFSKKGKGALKVMCQFKNSSDTLSTGLGSYKNYQFFDDFAVFENLNKTLITITDEYGPQGTPDLRK